MNATTVILGIIALASIVWTVLFILTFRQVKRMAITLENFSDDIQRNLSPLITDLSQASQQISQLSQNMEQKLNQTNDLFVAIKDLGETMAITSRLIKEGVVSTTTYVKSAAVGFRTAFDFLSKHMGKGGVKHGK